MRAKKRTYQELIHFIQTQTNHSYFKSRTILKELSKVLNEKVSKGIAIDCMGLFKVDFNLSGMINSNNEYFGINEQAEEISERLGYTLIDTFNVLKLYYTKMKTDIEAGYQVNVKSVGYIIPKVDSNGAIYLDARLSPQLKKPTMADFIVLDKMGDFKVVMVDKDKIRLSILMDNQLNVPYRLVVQTEDRDIKYIDL